jgi:signal-transduction protein with cAMP-binding, CBS, and nucleotidyltransferase domain
MTQHRRLPPLAAPAGSVMQPHPPMLPPTAPLADALAAMQAARANAVLAVDQAGRGIGILTEQDVVRRVAFRLPPEAPLSAALSTPLIAVEEGAHLYRAIGLMRRHRLRHLAVLDAAGRPVGLLHRGETLAALAGATLAPLETLAAHDSDDALHAAKDAQAMLATAMLDDKAPAEEAVALVNAVNHDLHRAVMQAALAAQPTPPPVPFTLLLMGSAGRGESLLRPDQDNGLIVGDYPDADHDAVDAWLRTFAEDFTARLDEAGFPLCTGHVMATNPLWRKRLGEWQHQFTLWGQRRRPAMLLHAAIAFDFAPAWGDPAPAGGLRAHLHQVVRATPALLAALAAAEAGLAVGLTFWGGFADDEPGPGARTDLKLHGLMPLVASVRLLALRAGTICTGTGARIAALAADGALTGADAEALSQALARLLDALLRQQLADLAAGRAPGSLVDTAALDRTARAGLRESLRHVRDFAKVVRAELAGG